MPAIGLKLFWLRQNLVQVSHILATFRERDGRSFLTGRLLVA